MTTNTVNTDFTTLSEEELAKREAEIIQHMRDAITKAQQPQEEKTFTVDDVAAACKDFIGAWTLVNDISTFMNDNPDKADDADMDLYDAHKSQRRSLAALRDMLNSMQ